MINVFKIKKGLIKTNKNHTMPFYKKSKLTKKSLKVKIFRVYLETLKSVPDDSILHYSLSYLFFLVPVTSEMITEVIPNHHHTSSR